MADVNLLTAREPAIVSSNRSGTNWPAFAGVGIFLGLLWYPVIHHLGGEWSYNPQYSYGWSVPLLVLFLLTRRWPTRPPVQRAPRTLSIFVLVSALLLLVPVRFVSEANPDWRLLSWIGSLLAVAASLALLHLLGGKPWARHFAFPFLFFLVAVPWPVQFEQRVIQGLMQIVTSLNVFGLHLAGIPALQHGNVIEVGSGLIGIEEACSGVRSLQATLMISLFLGELHSFTWTGRALLVGAGALLAFVCNLVRTAFLVYVGSERGTGAIHAWHDPAGLAILLCCLFGLWLISLLMKRSALLAPPLPSDETGASRQPSFAPGALVFGCVVLFLSEAGVRWWYDTHGSRQPVAWNIRWPNEDPGYRNVPIAPEAQGLLQYNEGGGASWEDSDARTWVLYHFRWLPGRTAGLFIKVHRPDVCLPASGMTLRKDDGLRPSPVAGLNLPVHMYRFDQEGRHLHVLYCYWDARASYESSAAAAAEDWSPKARIQAALRGQREAGAQMLELGVWDYEDDEAAWAALQKELGRLVSRN